MGTKQISSTGYIRIPGPVSTLQESVMAALMLCFAPAYQLQKRQCIQDHLCTRSEPLTKKGWYEGARDDIQRRHLVDAEVGAPADGAPHHRQRDAHEGPRDGQFLLLAQLHHEIPEPREGAVQHLQSRGIQSACALPVGPESCSLKGCYVASRLRQKAARAPCTAPPAVSQGQRALSSEVVKCLFYSRTCMMPL